MRFGSFTRRSALKSAAAAGAGLILPSGFGLSYTSPAQGAKGGKPRLREKVWQGVDLTKPRSPLPSTIETVCCRQRATAIRPFLIIDDGDKVYPIARRYDRPTAQATTATRPVTGETLDVTLYSWELESWEADRCCSSLGVYIKFPEFKDYAIAHFAVAPSLYTGNLLSVTYNFSN